MIRIVETAIRGTSEVGPFEGALAFEPGLQVIAADNHFGKSLAVTTIAWCLGLERMFGLQDDDPSRFPVAVRDVIDLDGRTDVPVLTSEGVLTVERGDRSQLRLTRAIRGDPSNVRVEELDPAGEVVKESLMLARRRTMKDETAGLQRFLFGWCDLPRVDVMDNRGEASELYLENIAPLFYVDQNEGWTDLQALQVHRYGLLEVASIAVEYLLGATQAVEARFTKQGIAARDARLKAEAAVISEEIESLMARHGWVVDWSHHGSVDAIRKRWSVTDLKSLLQKEYEVDLEASIEETQALAEDLRRHLAEGDLDGRSKAAASEASQQVIELKDARHGRREELRILRRQRDEQARLLDGVSHRLHSAQDVFRLKKEGIGRLDLVECPTCHRSLDPSSFDLDSQSTEAVAAHVDALDRDRKMIESNLASTKDQILRVGAGLATLERRLSGAERSLEAVNQAVGASREQLAKAATDLVVTEAEREKLVALHEQVVGLQSRVNAWIERATPVVTAPIHELDLHHRKEEFVRQLRALLSALGHSAILDHPEAELELDENYVPYLGTRRLRSLGSASDHSRLVAAYVLALAAASEASGGLHPGFVVLDEPLQQNPDTQHREMFVNFMLSDSARSLRSQTVVFTWLREPELDRLRKGGTRVVQPSGDHFLKLASPEPPEESGDGA